MRYPSTPKAASTTRGIITLELLIAFAVIILGLSACMVLVFGDQSSAIDGRAEGEALAKAEQALATMRAAVSIDPAFASSTATDGLYVVKGKADLLSPCEASLAANVSWDATSSKSHELSLHEIVADPMLAMRLGEPCIGAAFASGDWHASRSSSSVQIDGIVPRDIDVVGTHAYVAASSSGATFFSYDLADANHPVLLGSVRTNAPLAAVDAANGYAYVASTASSSQLLVIDASSSSIVASSTLPGVAGSFPGAISVFYYDKRAYVGTKETAGKEFHVFDVSTPTHPTWLGAIEITHNVNAIIVRDGIAYLATSGNSAEVTALDVSNPAAIAKKSSYDAAGSNDNLSLFLMGDRLYVGRKGGNPNLYVLDVSDPAAMKLVGTTTIGLASTLVKKIVIDDGLAFLVTNQKDQEFQVWDVSDPAHMTKRGSLSIAGAVSLDLVGSNIALAAGSSTSLSIIAPY